MSRVAKEQFQYCEDMLRAQDKDLWLACLFIPLPARQDIHVIYAFITEIRSASAKVSQPLLGEMRLRWWHDALAPNASEDVRAHPIVDALHDVIDRHDLPRAEFYTLLEAHLVDFYDAPFAHMDELTHYCLASVAAPIRWAAYILKAPESPAFDEAGVSLGLTRALIAPSHKFIPTEFFHDDDTGLEDARHEILQAAKDYYARAERAAAALTLGKEELLPASMVPLYLDRLQKSGDMNKAHEISPLYRQWRLWRAARKNGL